MIRRQYYGWFDADRRKLLVSRQPPDAPVRPAMVFDSQQAVRGFIDKRKGRVHVLWSPPLPPNVDLFLTAS